MTPDIRRSAFAGSHPYYVVQGKEADVAHAIRDALADCATEQERLGVVHAAEYIAHALYGRPEDQPRVSPLRQAPDRFFEEAGL